MSSQVDKNYRRINTLALVSAFIAMIAAIACPFIVLSMQPQGSGSIWPLPALVLIDWSLSGNLAFLAVYSWINTSQTRWLKIAWFVAGMLVPLFF